METVFTAVFMKGNTDTEDNRRGASFLESCYKAQNVVLNNPICKIYKTFIHEGDKCQEKAPLFYVMCICNDSKEWKVESSNYLKMIAFRPILHKNHFGTLTRYKLGDNI